MAGQAPQPAPNGRPVVGHALAFSRDPFGALERWAAHDDVVRLAFLGDTFYLVSDPELIEAVLYDGADRFTIAEQQQRAFAGVEDHAVTTSTGDRWRRIRTALQPAFTREAIETYAEGMVDGTIARIETWDEGAAIDLHREMRSLTLHILADTLLDVDIDGDEAVVLNATDALVDRGDPRRPGQLLPDWIPTPTDRRFRRAVSELDAYVDCVLDERGGGTDGDDACSVLLAAHERGELSMAEVRHNLVALLLAGSDTSALALTYCWYALSEHPEVHGSLVDEYDEQIGAERPTAESRERMEELGAAVTETLRLYPPTWNTMRRAKRSVTLGEYRLPGGAELMMPQWVLHRDERFWTEPTEFRPSRWRTDQDRPEFAYFPFSGGPRHCIGMQFAWLELQLALATMIGRVELDVTCEGPLTFAPTLSLRPETKLTATVRHR